jgi:putative drug exporter of the RND superfamily
MTGLLYRIGGFCVRHHYPVIAAWVVLVVVLALVGRFAGGPTSDNLSLPGTGSTRALDLLQERLPNQANGSNPIVLQASDAKLTSSKNKQAVQATVKSLEQAPHVIRVVSPLGKQGSAALSKDKKIGFISVTLDLGPADLDKDEAEAVIDAADPARDAGLKVATGGYLGQEVSKPSTEISEAIGLAAAMVILLFAFGTATAMGLPIVTAVLGLVSTLSIIGLLGHAAEVPTIAPTLATMIGLGVGIDYALFIVTRHKLQLQEGLAIDESIARATATAGGAVFFAGGTVVIALCSLSIAGIPLVSTLGFMAAIAVLVAVLAATTLLPALLGALGPRINSLRVPLGRKHPDDHEPHGYARWARWVAHRPWRSIVASVVVLVVLALPLLDLHLGQNDVGALPKSTTARQAYDLLSEGFGPGENGPLLVAVRLGSQAKPDTKKLNKVKKQEQQQKQKQQKQKQQLVEQGLAQGLSQADAEAQAQQQIQQQSSKNKAKEQQQKEQEKFLQSPASDPRLQKVQQDLEKTSGVKSVSPPQLDKRGNAAVFTVIATTAPSSRKTEDLVRDLRSTVLPKATAGTDLTAYVGGTTAGYIDLADRISDKLPSMIAIVVGLSMVVLLLAFRSVVIPIKAAVANLLSVAAAYGIVTAVFQKGWGAGLIGLEHAVPIVSFVPLLMFAILFGLSMDYEVFLLTQMQEHYKESKDPTRAVIDGLASTGRVITSAALIMVCVFTSFVLNGDPLVKQFGVGLAVAIAIDATLVRCLFVPAVMVKLGKAAWWLPSWLGRALPGISIEGGEYFARRRAAEAAPRTGGAPATKA